MTFEQPLEPSAANLARLQQQVDTLDALLQPLPEFAITPDQFSDPALYSATVALYHTAHAAGSLAGEAMQQKYRAEHDALTGLRNRETWLPDVSDRISVSNRKGEAFGLAFLDLDAFKAVNDRFGHEAGDELLITFASFMREKLRRTGDAWRLGGDEFATMFNLTGNDRRAVGPTEIVKHETAWLKDNFESFVTSLPAAIRRLGFDVSIGVAVFDPAHPVDAKTLVAQADQAMYQAKERRKTERRITADRRR